MIFILKQMEEIEDILASKENNSSAQSTDQSSAPAQ